MEGYSQQGFRPGRLVMIISAQYCLENIGKLAELVRSVNPGEHVEFEGRSYFPDPQNGEPSWIIRGIDGPLLSVTVQQKFLKSAYSMGKQSQLMLIDDPDKELDTIEERLNNAHPLLLTHKQEEKV